MPEQAISFFSLDASQLRCTQGAFVSASMGGRWLISMQHHQQLGLLEKSHSQVFTMMRLSILVMSKRVHFPSKMLSWQCIHIKILSSVCKNCTCELHIKKKTLQLLNVSSCNKSFNLLAIVSQESGLHGDCCGLSCPLYISCMLTIIGLSAWMSCTCYPEAEIISEVYFGTVSSQHDPRLPLSSFYVLYVHNANVTLPNKAT